ncbi:MAG: hypothetical protein R3E73_10535 [Porticoccaceae bacterium]|nr:hypothetical protein [Pseudomonadales bacterium]MCP5171083.1 hypothetical protein [Pseudomonadales bacterium]MCP5301678.1 hypothetical protein [Pseudomonadales bacterium]
MDTMIKESDLNFHIPVDIPHDWAETGYFNIYIPEQNIFCWIYIVHRAGVGVTVSDVEIIDNWSDSLDDAVYIDYINHNPLPEKATKFVLPSGLSFHAKSLREYSLVYEANGVAFNLDFTSIMEPYDIHDASMDPLATDDQEAAIANTGFGSAYASHFDMSVRAKGVLTIGDETYSVDCVSTMDHSWGPRPENNFSPMTWNNAHFGEGYVVHAIFAFDRFAPAGKQHQFKHGYALVDGKVRGAKSGSAKVVRNGDYVIAIEMRVVDVDDREHIVHGVAVSHTPWRLYGNAQSTMAMMEWRRPGSDDVGCGTYFDTWPLNRLRNA